jgi:hypothetical protein
LREEGSLGYDGGLVRLQVQTKLDTHLHRQQAPFSGAVAGEQVIKIRSFIAFREYFQFSFSFSFLHLLTFDHPQNQSNVV